MLNYQAMRGSYVLKLNKKVVDVCITTKVTALKGFNPTFYGIELSGYRQHVNSSAQFRFFINDRCRIGF